MKLPITGMMLFLFAATATAQVGSLENATVLENTSLGDPAKAVAAAEGQWIAFSMPVLEGTQSPCCWKGQWKNGWNDFREVGCSLERQEQSYGTHSDSPMVGQVNTYAKISDGEVISLRVVGEQCPVDGAGATLTWIGSVEEEAGLDWLEATARASANDTVAGAALYAMALHRSNDANMRLHAMALKPGGNLQQESIFWLGEARGDQGLDVLKRLLAELPTGDARREINFALSMNGSKSAVDLLTHISRTDEDPEQWSNALFVLAIEFPEVATDLLREVLASEQDEQVMEQAVFAVSQLPGDTSTKLLLDLAQDEDRPREVRRQALFWLANSDDDDAVAALAELLTQ